MSKAPITKPPLGWNSYDGFGCHIYEELCMRELKAFAETYAPHGYEYFVIDSGWFAEQELIEADGYKLPAVQHADPEHVTINEYGIQCPCESFFPNGFTPLIEFCRANGIKLGVHLMRGIPRKAVEQNTPIKGTDFHAQDIANVNDTCAWCDYMYGVDMTQPGAQAYLDSVMEQFSQWGIEFVKVDDVTHRPAEIEGYVQAVEKASGPISLSLSAGGTSNKRYLDTYQKTAMCRITHDIWDTQEAIGMGFEFWKSWQGLEQEDFYPDLDMIPFGELCVLKRPANFKKGNNANFCAGNTMHHVCYFTEAQKETFLTQRAMSASPLMIGGSLESMDEHSVGLLTHPDMLACNQNGIAGRCTMHPPEDLAIFVTPEKQLDANGLQRYEGSPRGWLGVFNLTGEAKTVSLSREKLGLRREWNEASPKPYQLQDIWRGGTVTLSPEGSLETELPANGVAFYRFDLENVTT